MAKKSSSKNMSKNPSKKRVQQKAQEAKKKKEQLIFAIGAVVIAVLAFVVFGTGGNANTAGLPPEINTQTAKQMFDEGAFMLDVRTPQEWEMYHVDGATLIELDYLAGRVDEVPRDQEIIVICNSGNRSQVARDILLEAGFTNVTSIAGGIQGWMGAGYDFVSGK